MKHSMMILSRMIDNFFKVIPTAETLSKLIQSKKDIESYARTFGLFIFEEESIKMNSHIRKAQLDKYNTENQNYYQFDPGFDIYNNMNDYKDWGYYLDDDYWPEEQ